MTVLVTGASGHVGANLVRALLARGRRVRALIHDGDRALAGLDLERVAGDVRDATSLRRAMRGAEVVHHLAAVISIDGDRDGRVTDVNVRGAANVAEAALEAGVRRLVHVSSVHAFDLRPRPGALDETGARSLGEGHHAYDRSKALGERAVRNVVARGLDAVILHPTGILGPFDFGPSRMGRVLMDLYRRRLPALVEGGFDWVDVRDVCAAALAAEERGGRGESYLIAGRWASPRRVAELAAEVTGVGPPRLSAPMWLARLGAPFAAAAGRLLGREPLFTPESLAALRARRLISSAKAARDLGHAPRPLRESIADAYAWFFESGALRR